MGFGGRMDSENAFLWFISAIKACWLPLGFWDPLALAIHLMIVVSMKFDGREGGQGR